jgi:hypothetical protein
MRTYNLRQFGLGDMSAFGAEIRAMGEGASCMEEVADRIVGRLHASFVDRGTGERNAVLVRVYKTHPYGDLDERLRAYADAMMPDQPKTEATKCLTLLATAGERPEWGSRRASRGHQTIPLVSEQLVVKLPMIAQLVRQLGLDIGALLTPTPELLVELERRAFNVFYVPEAKGSPHIPAQEDFVIPHGIRSVLGFGGMLPCGDMIALIVFTRVSIPRPTAEMFKTVALNLKMAVLPFQQRVFAD